MDERLLCTVILYLVEYEVKPSRRGWSLLSSIKMKLDTEGQYNEIIALWDLNAH